MRSGWNTWNWLGFSPVEMNLMGLPVTLRTERAPPPRESPSSLVMITPSKSTRSAKTWTTFTMSWPVMESTTMRIWSGLTAALMSAASCHHGLVDLQAAGGVDNHDVLHAVHGRANGLLRRSSPGAWPSPR